MKFIIKKSGVFEGVCVCTNCGADCEKYNSHGCATSGSDCGALVRG
ncbi:MAG: hypothetical protein K6G72_01530 [Lachnospiraceae bacterium]|nr:hypothetical protein [Lachnospiraceae bacterium]